MCVREREYVCVRDTSSEAPCSSDNEEGKRPREERVCERERERECVNVECVRERERETECGLYD